MTYRNRALLDLCHEAPCCLQLGAKTWTCGLTKSVPCHSDMIRHGRAVGQKSHDCFAVPGCPECHARFTRANLGKDGYHAAWTEAMERYILWQWVSGKVRLADITQRPKEPSMEAPMCRLCEKRHWARDPHIFGKNTSADRGEAPKGGERRARRSANSSGSRFTAAESKSGMRPSRHEEIDPVGGMPAKNTSREGRRVLKAEAARRDATRTAATAKPNPPAPSGSDLGALPGNQTKADKVTPGKRKTATKKKRKAKKMGKP